MSYMERPEQRTIGMAELAHLFRENEVPASDFHLVSQILQNEYSCCINANKKWILAGKDEEEVKAILREWYLPVDEKIYGGNFPKNTVVQPTATKPSTPCQRDERAISQKSLFQHNDESRPSFNRSCPPAPENNLGEVEGW